MITEIVMSVENENDDPFIAKISKGFKDEIVEFEFIDNNNIKIFSFGIDYDELKLALEKLGLGDEN
jgi:hypothetical protein